MPDWRLVRVEVSSAVSDNGLTIDDVELLISGTDQTSSTLNVAASSTHETSHYTGGSEAYNLFRDDSTWWDSDFSGTWPQWFQWDFGSSPKDIDELTIKIKSNTNRAPKAFTVKYSNDGETWTSGSSFSGLSWSANEKKTFSLTTPSVVPADPTYTAPTIDSVDTVHNTTAANKITFTRPSAATTGSLLVVSLCASWNVTSITPPTGWSTIQVNNSFPCSGMFYKIIADIGTEPSSYDFGFNATQRSDGAIYCISGFDSTAPVADSSKSGVVSNTITYPPIKSVSPDYLLLALAINGDVSTGTFTVPSGMTADHNVNNTSYLFAATSLSSTIAQSGFKGFVSASGRSISMMAAIKGLSDSGPPVISSRVTQTPVILSELRDTPSRVTSVPVIIPYIGRRPSRVTQAPIEVVQLNKAVPLPSPLVPEVPFTETWEWLTVISVSENGKEQRSSLRTSPRIGMKFSSIILDEEDRVEAYNLLFKYCDKGFNYPLYVYYAQLSAAASQGDTKLYFDPQYANLRDGERAALYDPSLETTTYVSVLSVDVDGCTLAEPLLYNQRAGLLISPAPEFKSKSILSLEMSSIDGSLSLDLTSLDVRDMLAPGQSPSITTYDGYLVLEKRPLTDGSVEESFSRDTEWVDNDISRPREFNSWNIPFNGGSREFLAHRPQDIDYWRAFSDHVKGMRVPFLAPTFRDDLPLTEIPALGSTTIVTSNAQFLTFWTSPAYRYLRLERADRSVIYRRIVDVTAVFDEEGSPTKLSILLNASVGSSAGNNQIRCVSYMNLCRMDTDTITLTHDTVDTVVGLSLRTVER